MTRTDTPDDPIRKSVTVPIDRTAAFGLFGPKPADIRAGDTAGWDKVPGQCFRGACATVA